MRLRIAKIREQEKDRPAGYFEEVISRGIVDGDWLEISTEAHAELREKYRPPSPPRLQVDLSRLTPSTASDHEKQEQVSGCCDSPVDEIEAEQAPEQERQVSFPNVQTLALNLASAVGAEVKSRFLGNDQIDLEEINRRLAICEGCEFFHSPSQRCKKCGCYLKWKTAWRSQKCPVGKW